MASLLTEYPDPDVGNEEGRTHIRYVEAKTYQTFGVQVKFEPGFDFQNAPFVYWKHYVDDSKIFKSQGIARCSSSHNKGVLRREIYDLDTKTPFKDDATGEWKDYLYVFGALGTSKLLVISFMF